MTRIVLMMRIRNRRVHFTWCLGTRVEDPKGFLKENCAIEVVKGIDRPIIPFFSFLCSPLQPRVEGAKPWPRNHCGHEAIERVYGSIRAVDSSE